MRIQSTGVGIGTTSPSTPLHARKVGNPNSGGNRNTVEEVLTLDAIGHYPYTGYGVGINFEGEDYGNTAIREYGKIQAVMTASADQNSSGDPSFASALTFWTNTGGASNTAATEKLRITSAGLVGIGTTSPSADLHLYHTDGDRPHLLLENYGNRGTGDAPILEFYLNDQTTGGIADNTQVGVITFAGDEKDGGTKETYGQIRGVANDPGSGSSNKGTIDFMIQKDGTLTQTMALVNGKVGIGTGTPDKLLEVSHAAGSHDPVLRLTGTHASAYSGGLEFYSGYSGGKTTAEMYSTASGSQGGEFWINVRDQGTNALVQRMYINNAGHITPGADNTQDLGASTSRWRNIYTADLGLSNKGGQNVHDGTWGDYTIQEGEDDLFLVNNRNNKIYKFNLTEVGDKPDLDSSLPEE